MFLDYWMILVLFVFLYLALTSVYFSGYNSGFGEGGAYGYLTALQELQRKVLEEQSNIEK
tara:strand:- start:1 stop:180 length:180 start_codon:yes stop_codon:yes gene_type:complete